MGMLEEFIATAFEEFSALRNFDFPWLMTESTLELVRACIPLLGDEYRIEGELAVHHSANLEPSAIIRGPAIIGPGASVGVNAYLREGVFLGAHSRIGPICEVKSSFVFSNSSIAHLNYVGHSLIGSRVNLEAGAVTAVHFNEREDKSIHARWMGEFILTNLEKFGAVIGDDCKLGANSVTMPGTILKPGRIVARLGLVDQLAGA
jgi:UDP-N-acetylglucosamine diphosphorylase / glucose-1-phosphate thymidylyltransferase / UDP-N-acetylgalactosamine diphosphorylase / glucosamine-1-phosphate N-acetyltransferase / galactosamine-1-phosphate N-acetyltransferase